MSFWSWIGLADKKEISLLQSEMSFLREENKVLQEQNRRLFEYIEENGRKNRDIIVGEISNIREQNEKYRQLFQAGCNDIQDKIGGTEKSVLEKLQTNSDVTTKENNTVLDGIAGVSKLLDDIVGEISNIREQNEKYRQLFQAGCNDIQDKIGGTEKSVLEKLQTNSDVTTKENSAVLDGIAAVSKLLDEKMDNMDTFREDLSSLAESVKYLWTIMKAVWVDSVLSDMDSLG